MSERKPLESMIAADIGSTLTHVCLIDTVEGTYRLVAQAESPSTIGAPENDLIIGLRRCIRRLEQIAQRPFLDKEGEIIIPEQGSGAGIDLFAASSNAAPPLRCVIVGLTNDLSVKSAQRACATANVSVSETIPLGARLRRWDDQMLISLRQSPPDLILLVGGMDTGPVAPVESAARVLSTIYEDIPAERRPIIVFAGNQEARRPVAMAISSLFDLRVVDNVRPNAQSETPGELQRELAEIYENVKLATLPGYRRLRRWCKFPILSTSEAFGSVLCFLAQRGGLASANGDPCSVLGVDVGGTSTHVGVAQGGPALPGGSYRWAVSADLGCSYGIDRVLALSGPQDIVRWLPVSVSAEDAISRLENVRLRPHTIPQTMDDVFLTHAVVRQALLFAMQRLPRPYGHGAGVQLAVGGVVHDLIVARGGALVHTAQDGLIALTLLDALQPVGVTRLIIDWASIWPQVGAWAMAAPLAAVQVLERDGLRELGTVIAPSGTAREGERALHLSIVPDSGPVVEADIPVGAIQCFPLAPGQCATVGLRPGRLSTAAGFGFSKEPKDLGGQVRVRGGSLGLIVDARGRPLILPQDPALCQHKLQQWLGTLTAEQRGSDAGVGGEANHVERSS